MNAKISSFSLIVALCAFNGSAHASGWTTNGITITRTDSGTDGNLISVDVPFTEGCTSGSLGRIDDTSPNLNRIMSLAMVAMASGLKAQFFTNGCVNAGGATVAKITDIRVSR